MAPAQAHGEAAPSPLDRFLRVFADVRAGEAGTALLLLLNLFVLLMAYYVLKTVREPLILATGAEVKSYASAVMALTLIGFISLYSWVASRLERMRLIAAFTLFFLVCIELIYWAGKAGIPYVGFVFFVWVGIFNMATVAQFWAYANDLYDKAHGDRLFPLIAIGATGGSWGGAKTAEYMFKAGINAYNMLQVAAALLVVHLALYWVVNRGEARSSRRSIAATTGGLSGPGGFALVFASPYLRLIALVLVVLNLVNSTGEYVLDKYVVAAAQEAAARTPGLSVESFIGAFKGNYFSWVNAGAMLLQTFVASRLVKHGGLAAVLLMLPLVSLGSYSLIGLGVGIAVVGWAKTAENSTDYSIMNTAKQLLWLPTSREQKYKAKQAIDTFFVRMGDVLSAGLVFAGTHWLALSVTGFAWANVALVTAWVFVAVLLLRENRRLAGA